MSRKKRSANRRAEARNTSSHEARDKANVSTVQVLSDPGSPFVGPRPFTLWDESRFFGRDREVNELVSLTVANSFVLLLAQSGAGKSSLLNAGLTPLLQRDGFDVLIGRVRSTDEAVPVTATNPFIFNALVSWQDWPPNTVPAPPRTEPWWKSRSIQQLSSLTLAEFVKRRPTDRRGGFKPCVLVFDQFEELFTLHPGLSLQRRGFFSQVRDAVEGSPALLDLDMVLDPSGLAKALGAAKDPLSRYIVSRGGELRDLLQRWRRMKGQASLLTSVWREMMLEVAPNYASNPGVPRKLLQAIIQQLNAAIASPVLLEEVVSVFAQRAGTEMSRREEWFDESVLGSHDFGSQEVMRRNRQLVCSTYAGMISPSVEGDANLRVIFSFRQDYLASFTHYERVFSDRLRVRYQLERLRRRAALDAITGPLKPTGVSFDTGAAEELVDDLMRSAERVEHPALAGDSEFVEPVHLQIVCDNLWHRLEGATTITSQHLAKSGSIEEALEAFYDRCMAEAAQAEASRASTEPVTRKPRRKSPPTRIPVSEGQIRRWCEEKLITTAQTRALVFQDLQMTDEMPNEVVKHLDEMYLIKPEIRAGRAWYELSHERLIRPIRKSNATWFVQRQAEVSFRQQLEAAAQLWDEARSRSASASSTTQTLVTSVTQTVVATTKGLLQLRTTKDRLLRDSELRRALKWEASAEARELPPTKRVHDYILASKMSQERRRLYQGVGAIVFLLMMVLGFVTWRGRSLQQSVQREKELRRSSEIAVLLERAKNARFLLSQRGKEFEALVLGVRALKDWESMERDGEEPPPEVVETVRRAMASVGDAKWLRGLSSRVLSVEFSDDGRDALVLTADELTLWDGATGEFRWRVSISEGMAAKSKDDVSIPPGGHALMNWNTAHAPPALPSSDDQVDVRSWRAAAFGGQGRWIVTEFQPRSSQELEPMPATKRTLEDRHRYIRFWNSETGQRLIPEITPEEKLLGVTGDLSRVIVLSGDGVRLIDPDPGSQSRPYFIPLTSVDQMDISPDGKWAVVWTMNDIQLWSFESGSAIARLELSPDEFRSYAAVQFSRAGEKFMLWSGHGTSRWYLNWLSLQTSDLRPPGVREVPTSVAPSVWDSTNGKRVVSLDQALGPVVLLSDDGRKVASVTTRFTDFLDAQSGHKLGRDRLPVYADESFTYLGDQKLHVVRGTVLIPGVASGDSVLWLWDVWTQKSLGYVKGFLAVGTVMQVALAADRQRVVMSSGDVVWICALHQSEFNVDSANWRTLFERACRLLHAQPECQQLEASCPCGKSYPVSESSTSRPVQSIVLGPSGHREVPERWLATGQESLAIRDMKEAANYASQLLSQKFSVPAEEMEVVLIPSWQKTVYWDATSRAVFAPPELRAIPDLIYLQVAHAYVMRLAKLDSMADESQALLISLPQVLTVVVKKSVPNRKPEEDWLIGVGEPAWNRGLDIENAPRQAYVSFLDLGKDTPRIFPERVPQVAHMKDFVTNTYDGMYINCGIPNKAFFDVAQALGIEEASAIWVAAIPQLKQNAMFADLARLTMDAAHRQFGTDSRQHEIVKTAWISVGVPSEAE